MIDTHMIQASLVGPVAKLDIKDLLKSSPPPSPPLSTQPPPNSKSISVPSSYPPCIHMPSSSSMSSTCNYSASTAPPSTYTQHEQQYTRQLPPQPVPQSSTAQAVFQDNPKLDSGAESAVSNKRQLPTDEDSTCSPAKRGIKWSSAENVKVTRLRGRGTKWDDISRQIPGRSPTSCRLHYQNYLERRSQWDEEKKNRLARVYDRYAFSPLGKLDFRSYNHV